MSCISVCLYLLWGNMFQNMKGKGNVCTLLEDISKTSGQYHYDLEEAVHPPSPVSIVC